MYLFYMNMWKMASLEQQKIPLPEQGRFRNFPVVSLMKRKGTKSLPGG